MWVFFVVVVVVASFFFFESVKSANIIINLQNYQYPVGVFMCMYLYACYRSETMQMSPFETIENFRRKDVLELKRRMDYENSVHIIEIEIWGSRVLSILILFVVPGFVFSCGSDGLPIRLVYTI